MTEKITVGPTQGGQRLDRFLADLYPQVSRAKWVQCVEDAVVLLNGKTAKPSVKLLPNDEIQIRVQIPNLMKADFSFQVGTFLGTAPEIVFEDSDLLVVNKAPDLAVHAGAGLSVENTLLGWALSTKRIQDQPGWSVQALEEHRPGVVHRLDKTTSGLLVMAKNPKAHEALGEQFRDHNAQRVYWAVVKKPLYFKSRESIRGTLRKAVEKVGSNFAFSRNEVEVYTLSCFLERDSKDKTRYAVNLKGEGRKSLTHFWVASESEELALLELCLETGRTHQIRVHLNFLGNPILGDGLYQGGRFRRIMLHAHTLTFRHPVSEKLMTFKAEWPQEDRAWLATQGINIVSRKELWPKLK